MSHTSTRGFVIKGERFDFPSGCILPLKSPLISLWRYVAQRLYIVLSVISTSIAWQTHLRATFPAEFERGLTIELERYDAKFDTTVILETEFHENNNIFVSHPNKYKRNWKIISAINVTCVHI